jgi:hypothetical protein
VGGSGVLLGMMVSVGSGARVGAEKEANDPQLVKSKLNRINVRIFLKSLNSTHPDVC